VRGVHASILGPRRGLLLMLVQVRKRQNVPFLFQDKGVTRTNLLSCAWHGVDKRAEGGPCAMPAERVIGWFRVQGKNNRLASGEQIHGPSTVAGLSIAASSENTIVGARRHSSS
jgi:hypothetical protein